MWSVVGSIQYRTESSAIHNFFSVDGDDDSRYSVCLVCVFMKSAATLNIFIVQELTFKSGKKRPKNEKRHKKITTSCCN